MKRIELRLSPAMKRLADSYYEKRSAQIARTYSNVKVNELTFAMMAHEGKLWYFKMFERWARELVEARFETYRDAFRRENRIPDEGDLSDLSWAFDNVIEKLISPLPSELRESLEHVREQIINDARRDIRIFAQELRLEQIESERTRTRSDSVFYTTNIHGANYGPIQQGGQANSQTVDSSLRGRVSEDET